MVIASLAKAERVSDAPPTFDGSADTAWNGRPFSMMWPLAATSEPLGYSLRRYANSGARSSGFGWRSKSRPLVVAIGGGTTLLAFTRSKNWM